MYLIPTSNISDILLEQWDTHTLAPTASFHLTAISSSYLRGGEIKRWSSVWSRISYTCSYRRAITPIHSVTPLSSSLISLTPPEILFSSSTSLSPHTSPLVCSLSLNHPAALPPVIAVWPGVARGTSSSSSPRHISPLLSFHPEPSISGGRSTRLFYLQQRLNAKGTHSQ